MNKIDENIDWSKRVLDIDIDSRMFNCMLRDMNMEIKRCVKEVFEEEFESGEISLKLSIEIPNAYENVPKVDENGQAIVETFKYRKPNFEHKITTTLKKQFKQEGNYTEKRDVQFVDGKFVAIPIKDAQISIYDKD